MKNLQFLYVKRYNIKFRFLSDFYCALVCKLYMCANFKKVYICSVDVVFFGTLFGLKEASFVKDFPVGLTLFYRNVLARSYIKIPCNKFCLNAVVAKLRLV